MATLRIHLFGGIRLWRGDRELTAFRSRKVALLLAYLLMDRTRLHGRVELATLLFPEQGEARARANLRTTLCHLKKLLHGEGGPGEPHLRITPQAIGFNPESDYRLDVEEFEALLERADRAAPPRAYALRCRALRLYRGEFLAGHYEDWVLQEQERLRLRYQEALEAAARYEEEHGLLPQAIAHRREQLLLSPLQEGLHRALIRLLMRRGDRAAARKQYRLCARLLAAELGVEPAPETRRLGEVLGACTPRPAGPREAAHAELARGKRVLEQGHLRAAERLLLAARRKLSALRDPAEGEALLQLGRVAHRRGNLDRASRCFARARALARRRQDTALEALALDGLGVTEAARGRRQRARDHHQRALRLAEAGHHPEVRWRVLNHLGRNHWLCDRYEEALRCYVEAQLLCEQLGEHRGLLLVLQNLGTLYSYLGLFAEAHRCYEEAQALAEGADDPAGQRSLWHNWGNVYERQGRLPEAARCYRRSYRIGWGLDDALGCGLALSDLGRVHGALGDLRRAERYLARALRRADPRVLRGWHPEVHAALAQVRWAQGLRAEALAQGARAVELLQAGAPAEEPERIYLAYAEVLGAAGDRRAARRALEEAFRLLQRRAARLERPEHRRSFWENVPKRRRIRALWANEEHRFREKQGQGKNGGPP